MSRRRTAALTIASIVAIGVGLNVTGVAPIPGGPVGASSLQPAGDFEVTILPEGRAGPDGSLYTTLTLWSNWPIPATLVSVRPELGTPATAVRVLGTHPNDPSDSLGLGAVRDPGTGWADPAAVAGATIPTGGGLGGQLLVLVKVSPTTDGDGAVGGFWLDYSVGPFRFRSVDQTAILLCASPGTTSSYPGNCTK